MGLPWYPTAEGPILGPRQHRPQTWSWGNDPPENGQYGAVGRQLSAHRPRLCPPEAVRGIGSHPTEVKRSRPISAAIGGRDPRSRAATRREEDEPCFLWIAEPACGSPSRLCRLQRRPTRVGLGCHPGASRLVGSTRGPVRNERAWPARSQHPPRQDLAWAISAGLRDLDRTDEGRRRARARKTKAVPGEGGVVRRRRCANPGAWRAQRFTGRRFFVPRRRRADFDAPALFGLAGAHGRRCALPLR